MDKELELATQEIMKGINIANERIANKTLGCYHCLKNPATQIILLITDKQENGANLNTVRTIVTGICSTCEMFASIEDKQIAADKLFQDTPQTRS